MGRQSTSSKRAASTSSLFRRCRRKQIPVALLYVTVQALNGDGTEELICYVIYKGGANQPQPASSPRWKYGTVPPGYEAKKACAPLKRASEYRVSAAIGGALAAGIIQIDAKGAATTDGDECKDIGSAP
jgi:hypothetical protein